jgi:ribosome biogenesis GTPase
VKPDAEDGSAVEGRIVASYGRRVLVEDAGGRRHPAMLARRRLKVVCGDRVLWRPAPGDDAEVTERLPRDNELTRPDSRGRTEVLAANLTALAVVCAPRPEPDLFMIDRYLAAAEQMGARGLVVMNKTDLAGAADLADRLATYRRVGYPVLRASALEGFGLDHLAAGLAGETAIVVGQSGVGKSSLINALCPDAAMDTAALSEASDEGRHTTTASVLHALPGGGALIDSPGVRDYAPGLVAREDVQAGFREFADPAASCRFSNCIHLQEPVCQVKAAVASGAIDPRRYESYRRLVRLVDQLGRPDWA